MSVTDRQTAGGLWLKLTVCEYFGANVARELDLVSASRFGICIVCGIT